MKRNRLSADQIIKHFGLQPLPVEGGLFHRSYLSPIVIAGSNLPAVYLGRDRYCGSAIYMLVTSQSDSFSALHKLITDEIYHFYLGDPVEMLLLYPDGKSEVIQLGTDILGGAYLQYVVRAGIWQGFRVQPAGEYALLGTTMAPGFDSGDFVIGEREELVATYPGKEDLIRQLTRPDGLQKGESWDK